VPGLVDLTSVRRGIAALAVAGLLAAGAAGEVEEDPALALEQAISLAETSLQKGDFTAAESHYREALFEGWRLTGTLETIDERLPEARHAYGEARPYATGSRQRLQSLAGGYLQSGDSAQAVEILTPLASQDARDVETRRLLAKALLAAGKPDEAVQRLDEAVATGPDDPEVVFLLASEYLWLKRPDAAARMFAEVVKARPIPQTHVLIGRAYRDAAEYERARAELRAALEQDSGVRRAHYYLGMVALADQKTGAERLELAEAEFRAELALAPEDPLTSDQLGLALLEGLRPADALPFLETAVRVEARSLFVYHLGRCQLALERTADAVASLRRALELAVEEGAGEAEREPIHFQLGQALRRLGRTDDAAAQLAEAGRLAARRRPSPSVPGVQANRPEPAGDAAPMPRLGSEERRELKRRVAGSLARAYFNLGVLQVQGQGRDPADRYARAAVLFEKVAELDPAFPQVQSSLGVAYFNARQFAKSRAPLTRALAEQGQDAGIKRMLAIACVNTEAWDKAAALLQDDPGRGTDPALEFTYGLALLRSSRPAEAERVFTGLAARRGDSAELNLVLGQAQAAQGRYDQAVASLQRAVEQNPASEEAHAALGLGLMSQGRAAEGLEQLEAAARLAPDSPRVHEQLGQAYQQLGRTAEAEEQLATVRRLQAKGQGPKP
jgi:tetratricopeptide (TPR) repeat protein